MTIAVNDFANQRSRLLQIADQVDAGTYDVGSFCYQVIDLGWEWLDRRDVPDRIANALIGAIREWEDVPNQLDRRSLTLRIRQAVAVG